MQEKHIAPFYPEAPKIMPHYVEQVTPNSPPPIELTEAIYVAEPVSHGSQIGQSPSELNFVTAWLIVAAIGWVSILNYRKRK